MSAFLKGLISLVTVPNSYQDAVGWVNFPQTGGGSGLGFPQRCAGLDWEEEPWN